jgi:hypothetical protein
MVLNRIYTPRKGLGEKFSFTAKKERVRDIPRLYPSICVATTVCGKDTDT